MIQEYVLINQRTLIVGANSGIAKELAVLISRQLTEEITVISRDTSAYTKLALPSVNKIDMTDYTEGSIIKAVDSINKMNDMPIHQVFIFHGILHAENIKPEKRLEDFNPQSFLNVITANSLTPLLWIKALTPILASNHVCKITVFSARVGSISDNQLGGWYSYRASKSALNMMLKTATIELARRAKNIKLISFHPGTTDTELSKPFQKNVPKEKLFTCEFTAKQLLSTVGKTQVDGKLSYLDWQGKTIPW